MGAHSETRPVGAVGADGINSGVQTVPPVATPSVAVPPVAVPPVATPSVAPSATPSSGAPVPTPASAGGKKPKENTAANIFRQDGVAMLDKLPDADKKKIGSKAASLEFIHALTDPRNPSDIAGADKLPLEKGVGAIVGVTFTSTEDVVIPRFSAKCSIEEGIKNPETEVSAERVPKNTPFDLTSLEALAFLSNVLTYAGGFSCKGTTEGCFMSAKASKYLKKGQALPTPTFNVKPIKAARHVRDDICVKVGDQWVCKDQYKPLFQHLFEKSNAVRGTGAGTAGKNAAAVAAQKGYTEPQATNASISLVLMQMMNGVDYRKKVVAKAAPVASTSPKASVAAPKAPIAGK
jgi:hypothetical protein